MAAIEAIRSFVKKLADREQKLPILHPSNRESIEAASGDGKIAMEHECEEILSSTDFNNLELIMFTGNMVSLLGAIREDVVEVSNWLPVQSTGSAVRFSESSIYVGVQIVPLWRVTLPQEEQSPFFRSSIEPYTEESLSFTLAEDKPTLEYRALKSHGCMIHGVTSHVTGEYIPGFDNMDGKWRDFTPPTWSQTQLLCRQAFDAYKQQLKSD